MSLQYIMDGYRVSHDPAVEYTVEPTTGRKLNILDVPGGKKEAAPAPATKTKHASSHRQSQSQSQSHAQGQTASDIAKGRALSPSKIQHPKPSKPYASRQLREADFAPTVDDLTKRFAGSRVSSSSSDEEGELSSSPPSSVGSSLSSRSSGSTSPSSLSSMSSDPPTPCRCERYGITRKGDRVKLDCGGSRCGYVTESSEASCSESEESDEEYRQARSAVRRQGIVVRR
jgi:hypothetical protein